MTSVTSLGLVGALALCTLSPTSVARQSARERGTGDFVGAVYAMTNEFDGNRIVAYGRNDDGTLTSIGSFRTRGNGGAFDGGEGLDPLISQFSLQLTQDNRFVLAVNAGSNSLSIFRVEDNKSLTLADVVRVRGVGPNSIAVHDDLVYVSMVDADGQFVGEPDQEGLLQGFRLTRSGHLVRLPGSARLLGNRPSAIQFSPDGSYLVVSSINAGAAALASGSTDEMVTFGVNANGMLTTDQVDGTASTLPGNTEGRNLPGAIGFEIVESDGEQIIVVTEAREFQPDGSPPAFPNLQTGSVSTWRLESDGSMTALQLDVFAGTDMFDGQRTACWIEFAPDQSYFWVSNALESSISSYGFNAGSINLVEEVAAVGTGPALGDPFGTTDGWVDLWISADGQYLYQLFGLDGTIGVFAVNGSALTLIEEVSGDLPDSNTQGIVAF